MKEVVILISILWSLTSLGQVQDSFADGNLDQNPTWIGDSAHFTVTPGKELRLDAPAQSGSSSLAVPSKAMGDASWRFHVRLDFNPSSSNYLDVHLNASSPDLDSSGVTSYFVRIGDTDDEVSLYKRTASSESKLIDGPNGVTDKDPVEMDLLLKRDSTGSFTLALDTSGGTNYDTLGTAYDDRFQRSRFFGFECRYTSTRSDRFYFDDILVSGSPYQDTIAPEMDTLQVPSKGRLDLVFKEPLAPSSFQTSSFELQPLSFSPDSSEMDSSGRRLKLFFPKGIPNDSILTLEIPSLEDSAGNSRAGSKKTFRYLVPAPPRKRAILINELMVDPKPSVGLPEREYLELHAADTLIQDLGGWTLSIDDKSIKLPERIVKPGQRLLLIAASDSSLFDPPRRPLFLDPFPALTNGGGTVLLEADNGTPIDSVSYRDDWYASSEKEDGGWALERIDPGSGCSKAPNWKASTAASGGTPGEKNSVYQANYDKGAPELKSTRTLNEREILLIFDEGVYADIPKEEVRIPNGPQLDSVLGTGRPRERILKTQEPLDTGIWYEPEVDPPPDCFGNRASATLKDPIVLPFEARKRDVVINEVLFDPKPGGEDFVELYNRSKKILDMSDWELAHYEDTVSGNERVGGKEELLLPGKYRFLSEAPGIVKKRFPGTPDNKGLLMEQVPSYPNDSGTVILTDGDGQILDRFSYRSSMHHPLLRDAEGVTLERIDPQLPTDRSDNWHSAASSAAYGTPGERNSQARSRDRKERKKRLWNEPKVFSPDMDGDRDRLRIHYRFVRRGMNCSIEVYDASGQRVKTLLDGEMLDKKGSLVWDGTDTNGKKAPVGIYVIVLECIHPSGDRVKEKESCVVGTRWNGR